MVNGIQNWSGGLVSSEVEGPFLFCFLVSVQLIPCIIVQGSQYYSIELKRTREEKRGIIHHFLILSRIRMCVRVCEGRTISFRVIIATLERLVKVG
jgi:hypothetical protein